MSRIAMTKLTIPVLDFKDKSVSELVQFNAYAWSIAIKLKAILKFEVSHLDDYLSKQYLRSVMIECQVIFIDIMTLQSCHMISGKEHGCFQERSHPHRGKLKKKAMHESF
jgi:hypothetical protein